MSADERTHRDDPGPPLPATQPGEGGEALEANDQPEPGVAAAEPGAERAHRRRARYQVVKADEAFYVVCQNAPNIRLRVERGLVVAEEDRKKYRSQTIFLDGAYAGPPFYDNKARHYSLDHHHGCVRAFTLSTCEQATVMLLQGLPLEDGRWDVYVNDPDLDAVLASWVLLNHAELLRDNKAMLSRAMPYIRVEGVIDAHGLDMGILTAMPGEVYDRVVADLDALMAEERKLKSAGAWDTMDWFQYMADLLEAVDRLVYPEGHLDRLLEVEELERVTLKGQKMAVLCRSEEGIYGVEAQLKHRYGKQLGVIVLDLGNGKFTLRQVDPFLDQGLTGVFELLNSKDPRCKDNGRENHWGGSDDIGGAPRKTGSGLSGEQVLAAVQAVYGDNGTWWSRLVGRLRGQGREE